MIQILLVLRSNNSTLALADGTRYEITFEAKCKFIQVRTFGYPQLIDRLIYVGKCLYKYWFLTVNFWCGSFEVNFVTFLSRRSTSVCRNKVEQIMYCACVSE